MKKTRNDLRIDEANKRKTSYICIYEANIFIDEANEKPSSHIRTGKRAKTITVNARRADLYKTAKKWQQKILVKPLTKSPICGKIFT